MVRRIQIAIQHKNIPEGELHETKGVSTATTGSVLTANAGAGVWTFPTYTLNVRISTLDTATSYYVVSPYNGVLIAAHAVIEKAIATANSVITPSIAGVDITTGIVTIPFTGSAAGNVVSVAPSALNSILAGQAIKFAVGGTTTGGSPCALTLLFLRTS